MGLKISIVTLSFNQGRFLETAIRSVVEQKNVDLDYILVDPGSTDDSRAIIENYRTKIADVVFDQDDGPADGLNNGFARTSGDICGFVNADDLLRPGALAEVVQMFQNHPEVDIISGHGHIIDAEDNPIRRMYSDRFSL